MTVVGRATSSVGGENLHQRNRVSDFAETGRVQVGIETGGLRALRAFLRLLVSPCEISVLLRLAVFALEELLVVAAEVLD
ncbi:MAG TPA: hypothetical protein VLT33_24650, partial [Labilithrix sp.]|nr:hypothetical protein [Labilithrix sp.]